MLQQHVAELKKKGYTVVPVFSPAECRYMHAQIEQFLVETHGCGLADFSRRFCKAGIFDGVQHLQTLWEIRTDPRVYQAFRYICYPNKKLYETIFPTIDRINYRTAAFRQRYERWYHWDDDIWRPTTRYQGFVALRDDCSLGIVRGSHLRRNQMLLLPLTKNKMVRRGCEFIVRPLLDPVHVPAGSLVIWNSRCMHTPCEANKERLVAYVRYSDVAIPMDDDIWDHHQCSWSRFDYSYHPLMLPPDHAQVYYTEVLNSQTDTISSARSRSSAGPEGPAGPEGSPGCMAS